MTINLTTGIDVIRSATNPTSRARPAVDSVVASRGTADHVTLSAEVLAMRTTQDPVQRFPPEHAPEAVRDAWAEATGNLSDMQRLAVEGAFMAEEISANLKYDASGRVVGVLQRDEPGYTDLWHQPGLSYSAQVDQMLEKLEQNRGAYESRDYAFFHGALADFRSALSRHGGI